MDQKKLRGRIIEKYETQEEFAKALGVTPGTLSQKLKEKRDLKREEIAKWCKLLEIPFDEMQSYFFKE